MISGIINGVHCLKIVYFNYQSLYYSLVEILHLNNCQMVHYREKHIQEEADICCCHGQALPDALFTI